MTAFNINSTSNEVVEALAEHIRGKNVIVTGASPGGLGAEVARAIAKQASLVVVAGHNAEKLSKTIDAIKAEQPSANLRPLVLDLASLAAVRTAAAEVQSYPENFHVLINNAAIMNPPYSKTVDGFESQMGTNHFGPFLFTALIFSKIAAAGTLEDPARIVNVSSGTHRHSAIRFDDMHFSEGKTYEKWTAYGQSKTANILVANEIVRRSKEKGVPVVAYSLHPGGLQQHMTEQEWLDMGVKNEKGEWLVHFKTVQAGAATHIVAAFDPSLLATPGAYLEDGDVKEDGRSPHAASQVDAEKLWEVSETAVKEKFVI